MWYTYFSRDDGCLDKVAKPSYTRINIFRVNDFFLFIERDGAFFPFAISISSIGIFICYAQHGYPPVVGSVEFCQVLKKEEWMQVKLELVVKTALETYIKLRFSFRKP